MKDGFDKKERFVSYRQAPAPHHLEDFVHCFWELRTSARLKENFLYHVLPDACVNVLLNRLDTNIAAVTFIKAKAKTLDLGREFHYSGVQFLPGVWCGDPTEICYEFVDTPYKGSLPLVAANKSLKKLPFEDTVEPLSRLVESLVKVGVVRRNPLTRAILENLDGIRSVSEMARLTQLSTRQLQRNLKQMTGLTPHNLLKVLRLQRSLRDGRLDQFSDQSHFIHSFRNITGLTPVRYRKKFDV